MLSFSTYRLFFKMPNSGYWHCFALTSENTANQYQIAIVNTSLDCCGWLGVLENGSSIVVGSST